jgi:cyclase
LLELPLLKKRLLGVITIKNGLAVQSFGYNRYLPLGKPEVLAENLDRWGVDEIMLQCIDRSYDASGPDLETLYNVAKKGLGTPLIYSGGIRSIDDGMKVVQSGADRIVLDALLHDSMSTVIELTHRLGAQALIGSLPVSCIDNELLWYDYRTKKNKPLSDELLELLRQKVISEVILIDWENEGHEDGFQFDLIHNFPLKNVPIITFGGFSSASKIGDALSLAPVSAVAIGNFLNYREHAVAIYKKQLSVFPIRMSNTGEM